MAQNVPLNNENTIELYLNANERLRHHHDALWKEEVHYTWLIYIIIGGIILTLTKGIERPWNGVIAIVLALVGIFVCIIAFHVVSRERQFFIVALNNCKKYAELLGIKEYEGLNTPTPGVPIITWFKVTLLVPIIIFVTLIVVSALAMC